MHIKDVEIDFLAFQRIIHKVLSYTSTTVAVDIIEGKKSSRTLRDWMQYLDERMAEVEKGAEEALKNGR